MQDLDKRRKFIKKFRDKYGQLWEESNKLALEGLIPQLSEWYVDKNPKVIFDIVGTVDKMVAYQREIIKLDFPDELENYEERIIEINTKFIAALNIIKRGVLKNNEEVVRKGQDMYKIDSDTKAYLLEFVDKSRGLTERK